MGDSGRLLTVPSAGRATPIDDAIARRDALIRSAARRLTGYQRRLFQADVALELRGGNARQAERRFGSGRDTVATGLHELHSGLRCREDCAARGRQRSEREGPQLAADIRAIVVSHAYADPEPESARRDTDLSAAEVRAASIQRGYAEGRSPSERTRREILNRMSARLQRVRKGRPLKETKETDAIFANGDRVREQARDEPEAPEIARDAEAEVAPGASVRGGKDPDRQRR